MPPESAPPAGAAPGPAPGSDRLSTAEAARRLGVKPATLYAYVSRGMLSSRRAPGGRTSTFDPGEIARLAARARSGGRAGALELVVDSGLTLLDPAGRLSYRGVDAASLVPSGFEAVAEWLWLGERATGRPQFSAPNEAVAVARAAAGALGPAGLAVDRLRVAAAAAGPADALRFDRRPEAVARVGRTLLATFADVLPRRSDPVAGSIAARLYAALAPLPPGPGQVEALDAALVLLADHELATSTLAARVAASTWADPYLVVLAGLAALGGPLHGAAGGGIVALLDDAAERGATAAVGDVLRAGERVPGFGHLVYVAPDPRAALLFPLVASAWPDRPTVAAAAEVAELMAERGSPAPNVDFALAALASAADLAPGATEAIIAVARTAGWLAHAIEEYPHRLRFRTRATYTGPAP